MTTRRAQFQEDMDFWIMRRLQETPDVSQRQLARELGTSLGNLNYCLQALIEKGWIKMQNFSQSTHKMGYAYLLTPAGVAEKSTLTVRFLKRKMKEYEALQDEIEALRVEMLQQDIAENDPHCVGPLN
jgi:EPS-associated MarR family transcriptional regulator